MLSRKDHAPRTASMCVHCCGKMSPLPCCNRKCEDARNMFGYMSVVSLDLMRILRLVRGVTAARPGEMCMLFM